MSVFERFKIFIKELKLKFVKWRLALMSLKQKSTTDDKDKESNINIERSKIVERPEIRPYGARIIFKVLHKGFLENHVNEDILLDDGAIAKLSLADQAPWEGGQRFEFKLVGFPKASLAEENGRKLVLGLLWTSVSLNFGVRLEYTTHEPVKIFDRCHSEGTSMRFEMTQCLPPEWITENLKAGYMLADSINPALLLSMEIFSAAHLDENQRTKFLSIVSAIEPLAKSEPIGSEVDAFIDECLAKLKEKCDPLNKLKKEAIRQLFNDDECSAKLKQYDSIRGRLKKLKNESIRQAIKKLIQNKLSDDESAFKIIDNAYNLRSQIIHNGKPDDPDIDLSCEIQKVSHIIKRIYAKELGLAIKML